MIAEYKFGFLKITLTKREEVDELKKREWRISTLKLTPSPPKFTLF